MSFRRTFAHIVLPLLMLPGLHILRAQETTVAAGNIQVRSMRIAEIDADHLRVETHLTLNPAQNATLEDVRWSNMRFNGVPIFADAIDQLIELHKGKPSDLPPIFLVVETRDLSTTQPLRDAVSSGHARVEGEAVAALRLNALEKLALHTEHPRIRIPFSTEVPVEIPGGFVGRQAALGFLHVADSAIASRAAAGRLPYLREEWIRNAQAEARQNLVEVVTSYTVKTKGARAPSELSTSQLAFRLGGAVVTTAEAHAPWQFDPDFLARIQSHEMTVTTNSLKVQLRPLGGGAEDATSLDERGAGAHDAIIVKAGGYSTVQLRRRAAPGSLLLIHPPTPPSNGAAGWPAAKPQVVQPGLRAVVFRLHPAADGHPATVDAVPLQVDPDGTGGLKFTRPVDASAFGSPILTPDGVIGMVQDERAGTLLPPDLTGH